ncbi:serine protease [Lithospermum erythrorhizon]|uniref:Serine protease n=1 Tax=Lithospermum erythrorhizon TaxID=34254 RepID=A0AAV3NPG2_LITER
MHGVTSVVPDQLRHLHTTYTPAFLGLADTISIWPNADYADDVVVGILDTGVWPERESFNGDHLSPVPPNWKGKCEVSKQFPEFACNKKLIGAKAFYKGYEAAMGRDIDELYESKSPRDTDGHGTHTASTAAGSLVANASLLGYAQGEAEGMATKARIAAYKICWAMGCFDSDILEAMDEAVSDGVDIISLSVGSSGSASEYDQDSIAIGAFGAMLHVGASTIDREFPTDVVLGDGRVLDGVSMYAGEPLGVEQIPVIYAGSSLCFPGMLDGSKVAGKIVVCDRGIDARVMKGYAVKYAGGVGMILANLANAGEEILADAHLIAATMVGEKAGNLIKEYVKSTNSPTATIIFRGTVFSSSPPAPRVAVFSSRGPNHLTPEIIKPDVIAPGVNVLAGWTNAVGPTELAIDPRRVEFNILSGTSMACPHVSGLAALLRNARPNWTPSAIKSAIMISTGILDNYGNNITDIATFEEASPFDLGSGHIDPNRALHPGLVYDIDASEYVAWLCSIGYDSRRISVFLREPVTVDCSVVDFGGPGNLNYPSFGIVFEASDSVVKYKRIVRNVANVKDGVYEVTINSPRSVQVSVNPSKLVFSKGVEILSYEISFASVGVRGECEFGSIVWSDGNHVVRSPIAVSRSEHSSSVANSGLVAAV